MLFVCRIRIYNNFSFGLGCSMLNSNRLGISNELIVLTKHTNFQNFYEIIILAILSMKLDKDSMFQKHWNKMKWRFLLEIIIMLASLSCIAVIPECFYLLKENFIIETLSQNIK